MVTVKVDEKAKTITLIVKVGKERSVSTSGKSLMIASAGGPIAFNGETLKYGFNLYTKNPDYSPD